MKNTFVKQNNTYFYDESTPVQHRISKQTSYARKLSRRKDVFMRLWFEYENTISNNGYAVFYTFTYNNNAIPNVYGHNVHDYRHIDWLLRDSGFQKALQRSYNTRIKYCVCCEFGEGKGKRGYGNNPHYHVILYITAINPNLNCISSKELVTFVKSYWQGMDEQYKDQYTSPNGDVISYCRINPTFLIKNPQLYRFGMMQEGSNNGVVEDHMYNGKPIKAYRAFSYVCKYVTKDMLKSFTDSSIRDDIRHYWFRWSHHHDGLEYLNNQFLDNCEEYNVPRETFTKYNLDFVKKMYKNEWRKFRRDSISKIITQEIRTYEKYNKPRFRASQGLGYCVFTSTSFDYKKGEVTIPVYKDGVDTFRKVGLQGQLYRAWFYTPVCQTGVFPCKSSIIPRYKQTFYRPNGNKVKYDLEQLETRLSNLDERFKLADALLRKKINFDSFLAGLNDSDYICDIKQGLITDYDTYISSRLVSGGIARCPHHLLASVFVLIYSGRSLDARYLFSNLQLDYRQDYEYFKQVSRHHEFQKVKFNDFNKLNSNEQSFECFKDFGENIRHIRTLIAFLDWYDFERFQEFEVAEDKAKRLRQRLYGLGS